MKSFRFPLLLLGLSFAIPFIGNLSSYVDEYGMLHEPGFFTIIIGEILFVIAIVSGVITALKLVKKH